MACSARPPRRAESSRRAAPRAETAGASRRLRPPGALQSPSIRPRTPPRRVHRDAPTSYPGAQVEEAVAEEAGSDHHRPWASWRPRFRPFRPDLHTLRRRRRRARGPAPRSAMAAAPCLLPRESPQRRRRRRPRRPVFGYRRRRRPGEARRGPSPGPGRRCSAIAFL